MLFESFLVEVVYYGALRRMSSYKGYTAFPHEVHCSIILEQSHSCSEYVFPQ